MTLVGEMETAKKRAMSIIMVAYKSTWGEIANKAGTIDKNKGKARV
ncbi:2815_t:CDS:2 [Entrophospora sp. SA101]|nr:2815_t:CDS:2 [Entrophospora sp. SA101]